MARANKKEHTIPNPAVKTRTIEVLETAIDKPKAINEHSSFTGVSSYYPFQTSPIPRQERVILPIPKYSIGDTLLINLKTREAGIDLIGSTKAIIIGVIRNGDRHGTLVNELFYGDNSYIYEIEINGYRMKLNDTRVESVELVRPAIRKKIDIAEKPAYWDSVVRGQAV